MISCCIKLCCCHESQVIMSSTGDAYAVTDKTKVKRLKDRATYDRATVHSILDEAMIAHVGIVKDGYPLVLPMGVSYRNVPPSNQGTSCQGNALHYSDLDQLQHSLGVLQQSLHQVRQSTLIGRLRMAEI